MNSMFMPKWFVAIICAIGMGAVAYGMGFHNNLIFIIGIILVATTYVIIRRCLKDHLKDKEKKTNEHDGAIGHNHLNH